MSVAWDVRLELTHHQPDRLRKKLGSQSNDLGRILRFVRLMGNVMQTVFKLGIDVCVVLIIVVYPTVAVFRGRPVKETVMNSWGMQILYFTGLCLVIPAICSFFSRELECEIATNWVPDAPIIVPIAVIGWLNPLIVGSIASFFRKRCLSSRCSNETNPSSSSNA